MEKVVYLGSFVSLSIYIVVAIFGYMTWAGTDQEHILREKQNILEIDYKNIAFTLAIIALGISTIAACPINFLPAKESIIHL